MRFKGDTFEEIWDSIEKWQEMMREKRGITVFLDEVLYYPDPAGEKEYEAILTYETDQEIRSRLGLFR